MSDDAIRNEIHRKAAARAEATVYSMNNNYLTQEQKAKVEAVYQFPMGAMEYAAAFGALALAYPLWSAWLVGSAVGIVALLAARILPGKLFWPVGLLFGGKVSMIVNLALAALAFWMGRWEVALFMITAAFGIASFIEPPMWLWTVTRSDRVNPKYGIAKRMFGITFPFERELD